MQENTQKKNMLLPISIVIAAIIIAGALVINRGSDSEGSQKAAAGEILGSQKESSIDVDSDDHIRGNVDAPITILEYSDYQCPFCSRFHDTMIQILAEYPDKVRWVYRHFPLDSIHPYARKAAEASECAAEQDKFWEYSDQLFDNQSSIDLPFLKEVAQNIGLDTNQFNSCLDSEKYASKVEADYREGIDLGVQGTPGSFINGQSLGGAVPYDQLKKMIENLL